MSNELTIMPTKFTDQTNAGAISYGVRVYNGYDQSYDNTWEDIPDEPLEILKRVVEVCNDTMWAMLESVKDNKLGMYIGDNWYEWKQIRKVLK
jgi:hypothetical protein